MLHNYVSHARLIHVFGDEEKVLDALANDEAGFFFCGSGKRPDGYMLLQDVDAFREKSVKAAEATGEAQVIAGYRIRNYKTVSLEWTQLPERTKNFCGYSNADEAFALDAEVAQALALEIEMSEA